MKNNNPILILINQIKFPKILISISILLSIIGSFFQLLVPLLTQNMIDNFSSLIRDKTYIILFASIFLSSAIFSGISIYLITKIGESIIYDLTKKVWLHILKLKS